VTPRTISILYKTADPSKSLATSAAFYWLTLTQSGVSNFISSVERKFKRYMRSMHGKIRVGDDDMEVLMDTYDSALSWADLVQ
jgi:hypothetical protein